MNFNPNPSKQAHTIIFSRKVQQINHHSLFFNHNLLNSTYKKKHLGVVLDAKLDFKTHQNGCNNVNKKSVMN